MYTNFSIISNVVRKSVIINDAYEGQCSIFFFGLTFWKKKALFVKYKILFLSEIYDERSNTVTQAQTKHLLITTLSPSAKV